jgi:hypothetical protein
MFRKFVYWLYARLKESEKEKDPNDKVISAARWTLGRRIWLDSLTDEQICILHDEITVHVHREYKERRLNSSIGRPYKIIGDDIFGWERRDDERYEE